eukprot:2894561-Prymnesium_polylepis.1
MSPPTAFSRGHEASGARVRRGVSMRCLPTAAFVGLLRTCSYLLHIPPPDRRGLQPERAEPRVRLHGDLATLHNGRNRSMTSG